MKKDRELTLLLECRHPNIILALGVCSLAPPLGLVLVTERTWGTISDAMRSAMLGDLAATQIAEQILTALLYMLRMHCCHGGVDVTSVALLLPAHVRPSTAKLTNFTGASIADGVAKRSCIMDTR